MMSPEYQKKFYNSLARSNTQVTLVIVTLGILFGILLLILDYTRFKQGLFQEDEVYFQHFISHLALFISIAPALLILKNQKAINNGTYPHSGLVVNISIVLSILILIPLGLIGNSKVGSMVPFGALIIIINIVYQIPNPTRLLFNVISFSLMLAGILIIETSGILHFSYRFKRTTPNS